MQDRVRATYVAGRLARLAPRDRLEPLVTGELGLATEADAALPRALPSLSGPRADQFSLELGETAPLKPHHLDGRAAIGPVGIAE